MKFRDKAHEAVYCGLLKRCKNVGCETKPVMYLLSLVCKNMGEVESCFDFTNNSIKIGGLNGEWQTGSSMRAIKLAFNLWNGFCNSEKSCNVYHIFGYGLEKYFIEAIKLRYEI